MADQPTRKQRPRAAASSLFPLEGLGLDLRQALRSFRRQWGFTLAAVGVLGLGLGATTTLFSVVNGVLLRPLALEAPEELVSLGSRVVGKRSITMVSAPEFADLQHRLTSVQGLAATRGAALDLAGDGEAERVAASRVNPDFFRVLRVQPALGRAFRAEDRGQPVAILGHELWRRRYGGDPGVLGRSFTAREDDGHEGSMRAFTIVGIMPPGFRNPPPLENRFSRLPPAEIWTPMGPEGVAASRTTWTLSVVGRLKPGIPLEALQRELDALAASLLADFPEVHRRKDGAIVGLGAMPLLDAVVGDRARDLALLMGATALLLLIACTNVAGLLLARATGRERELWVKTALGAPRLRLLRQLLTESLLLGLAGGALGLGLTFLGIQAFRLFGPAGFPRMAEISVDLRVLVFSFSLSLFTGVLFGLAPALLASRGGAAGGTRVEPGMGPLKGTLLAGELAVALVLLTGSGLLVRSILRLQGMDPGIDPENVILMQVSLARQGAARVAFLDELRDRLAALPGVASASYLEDPPMGFNTWSPGIRAFGDDREYEGAAHRVGQDYFRTLGIRLLTGRLLGPQDTPGSLPVVVLSRELAESIWPRRNPLGRKIRLDDSPEAPWHTVVGVVNGVRQYGLDEAPAGELYLPSTQHGDLQRSYLALKTGSDPSALMGSLRQTVWSLDRNVPVPEITTMRARMEATLRLPRFRALLLGTFSVLALALVLAGVYGVVQYVVGRRTREVGIHMALGALPESVVARLLRRILWPILAGIGLGLGSAFGATRILASVLFEVRATDPATLLGLAAGLAVLSLGAAYVPIRRATRISPVEALRAE